MEFFFEIEAIQDDREDGDQNEFRESSEILFPCDGKKSELLELYRTRQFRLPNH
jgi:hypothetical protein